MSARYLVGCDGARSAGSEARGNRLPRLHERRDRSGSRASPSRAIGSPLVVTGSRSRGSARSWPCAQPDARRRISIAPAAALDSSAPGGPVHHQHPGAAEAISSPPTPCRSRSCDRVCGASSARSCPSPPRPTSAASWGTAARPTPTAAAGAPRGRRGPHLQRRWIRAQRRRCRTPSTWLPNSSRVLRRRAPEDELDTYERGPTRSG